MRRSRVCRAGNTREGREREEKKVKSKCREEKKSGKEKSKCFKFIRLQTELNVAICHG